LEPPKLDVVLVSTRRPSLVDETLNSFTQNLFRRIRVRRIFCNIDPLWGDENDDRDVEQACRKYFSDVVVRRPDQPGFGTAVKWLWAQPETEWFLHLEDDWVLRRPIDPVRLLQEMKPPDVAQISLSRLNRKAWRKGVWIERFTTSPSFVRTTFGELVSSLLDPELDPEKQMYGTQNPRLTAAIVGRFRHRLHGSRFASDFIADIGRSWRDERNIEKRVIDERSVWLERR
jgi:hypothetical protein